MAPLPENNTPRLFIEYTEGGQEHVLELRLSSGSTTVEAVAAYTAVAPSMAALLFAADRVTGARFAAAGSNFSFPISVSAQTGSASGTADADRKPYFVSVTGRSTDGRRVRVTMFTQLALVETNGYKIVAPAGAFATWRNAVTGASADARTISGQVPVWNSYLNVGSNAYFQRKARRTVG